MRDAAPRARRAARRALNGRLHRRGLRDRLRPHRLGEGAPRQGRPRWSRTDAARRCCQLRGRLPVTRDRDRLGGHLPAARDDDHRGRAPADRGVRVCGDPGGQAGPRPTVPGDGDARRADGWGVRTSGQRDHGAPRCTRDAARLPAPGRAPGAVPDRGGAGVQHRRHGHADRRPAQHHYRQSRWLDLQRLPEQPHPDHRGIGHRAAGDVPRTVPQVLHLRRRPGRRGDGTRRT